MCSYNRINDTWACENDRTINQDLKGSMGFQVCPVRMCVGPMLAGIAECRHNIII